MKSVFFGFYSISENDLKNIWKSDSTLFVFDTNCLLNLYRCEDQTRDDIISVMKEVSNRSWLSFQVGFEYQKNRRTVIEESVSSLIKIKNELEDTYNKNVLSSAKIKKHLYNALSDEISTLQKELKEPIDKYIKEKISPRIDSKKAISERDSIRHEIDTMFSDRVGFPPSQERINKINSEGETRYQLKHPPGFMDDKKRVNLFSFKSSSKINLAIFICGKR
ncbi:PIN-like domain-containing protein [Pantoea rwandensis]|uniref:PIN like domain-containing protein n=1 Tax=Pantoea rwandensis TaxID=1076550 RepID=A0A1X1CXQ3_9GAMM|nr:PIN-like domain-containing protein [Pantoea rwandensis]ORM69110.1 hypothetical protein HA51_12625 [Pantoea rwandensis]